MDLYCNIQYKDKYCEGLSESLVSDMEGYNWMNDMVKTCRQKDAVRKVRRNLLTMLSTHTRMFLRDIECWYGLIEVIKCYYFKTEFWHCCKNVLCEQNQHNYSRVKTVLIYWRLPIPENYYETGHLNWACLFLSKVWRKASFPYATTSFLS